MWSGVGGEGGAVLGMAAIPIQIVDESFVSIGEFFNYATWYSVE